MAGTEIVFKADEAAQSASIVTWIFKDGTPVKEGEVVCEVMVEKTQFDITAPATGTLRTLIAEEEPFSAGAVLGTVE